MVGSKNLRSVALLALVRGAAARRLEAQHTVASGKTDLARIDLGGSGVLEFGRAPRQADTTPARR